VARAVIDPNCGGRVLEFSLDGINCIYTNEAEHGWRYTGDNRPPGQFGPCAGRCDIGPEQTAPPHPILWLGAWDAKIDSSSTVRLQSAACPNTGVRLLRSFTLDPRLPRLRFTQTICNTSSTAKQYYHWSRTFVKGNGLCVVPLNSQSRFPLGFAVYGKGPAIRFKPIPDPSAEIDAGHLRIYAQVRAEKFAIDAAEGWIACFLREGIVFTKRFAVYPQRVYGDITANNVSIWCYGDRIFEIEPLGPLETIAPGCQRSFTEEWFLSRQQFPGRGAIDYGALACRPASR
jgi:hypothetical protein